jgi:hypothetical protein
LRRTAAGASAWVRRREGRRNRRGREKSAGADRIRKAVPAAVSVGAIKAELLLRIRAQQLDLFFDLELLALQSGQFEGIDGRMFGFSLNFEFQVTVPGVQFPDVGVQRHKRLHLERTSDTVEKHGKRVSSLHAVFQDLGKEMAPTAGHLYSF